MAAKKPRYRETTRTEHDYMAEARCDSCTWYTSGIPRLVRQAARDHIRRHGYRRSTPRATPSYTSCKLVHVAEHRTYDVTR